MFKACTLYTGIKSSGGYAEQSAMAEATKTTARPIGQLTYAYCRPQRRERKTLFTSFVSHSQ